VADEFITTFDVLDSAELPAATHSAGRICSVNELTRSDATMKLVVSKTTLYDSEDEILYWMTKPPEERVAAAEVLRQRLYGSNRDPGSRLQRVGHVIHT
jgi:hypothetical protein